MSELETLRPEVKDPNPLATAPTKWRAEHCVTHHHACDCREWEHAMRVAELEGRAEKAEAELAESRETIKRLNRRVQVAEAGVAEKVKASAGRSLGRALANAAADMYMHERDEAQAELAALRHENAQLRDVLADRDMDREMAAHANRELAALKARIAGAPVYEIPLSKPKSEDGWARVIESVKNERSVRGKRVRLLVVTATEAGSTGSQPASRTPDPTPRS